MSIFDFISGKKKLMVYEINMNDGNDIYVNVKNETPGLSGHEYLRLWSHYHCRIMHILGYPDNKTTMISGIILEKIIAKQFDVEVDCFQRAELDDVMNYSRQPIDAKLSFRGEFFSTDSDYRMLKSNFPYNITEQQVVYSSIGLLQYALDKCSKNQSYLDLGWKIILFLIIALANRENKGNMAEILKGVPEISYLTSLETEINEIRADIKNITNHDVEPPEDKISERFLIKYQEISKGNSLPESAANYIKKRYPVNSDSEHNRYLGGFFILGYKIRLTEESFASEYEFDINGVDHNKETSSILFTHISKQDKIEKIAEYKESNNTKCNLGPEVEDYSILGLDIMNQYFSYALTDYLKSIGFAEKFNLPEDVELELAGCNAALGYCFRLAEEIVNFN